MQRVDFYLPIGQSFMHCQPFACQLVAKAYAKGNKVSVLTDSPEQAIQLDRELWTWQAESFLPHHIDEDNPKLIHIAKRNTESSGDILLSLTLAPIENWQNFQRLLQVIPEDPDLVKKARDRYREYQQQGLTINTHKMR